MTLNPDERDSSHDTGPEFADVEVQLSTESGNGFVIVSRVRSAMERAGYRDEAKAYFDEALSGNYDHLLQVTMRTVTVR